MSASIQKSAASYSSGLECWAAFCDALGIEVQFPASEELVIRFPPLFHNRTTLPAICQTPSLGHRFLRPENTWHTGSLRQVVRGGMRR